MPTPKVAFLLTFTFNTKIFVESSAWLDGTCLTYSATNFDDTPLPAWLTFTPATRKFSGTPAGVDRGLHTIKVTAKNNM